MKTVYRAFLLDAFALPGHPHPRVDLDSIAEVREGFWIDGDARLAKREITPADYWVPPHAVQYVRKVRVPEGQLVASIDVSSPITSLDHTPTFTWTIADDFNGTLEVIREGQRKLESATPRELSYAFFELHNALAELTRVGDRVRCTFDWPGSAPWNRRANGLWERAR